ncbi:hypothetical protein GH714_034092 [Hevea brasiliensis]|uniref:Uncharacterized protein n=1 Tax=Hevea brasiliensis TaxID=3981 RepID=A0A6A6NE87_HEVBR|nr:hypothetical protein GH714_034092 [Hevea brasiliensis]
MICLSLIFRATTSGVLPKEFGLVLPNLFYNMSRNNFNGEHFSSKYELEKLEDIGYEKQQLQCDDKRRLLGQILLSFWTYPIIRVLIKQFGTFDENSYKVHGANLSRNKLDAVRILLLIDHQGHIDKIIAIDIDNTRYHIKAFEESCSELYKQFPQNRKRESPSSSCEDDDRESSNISADVGKNLSKAIGDSDHDDVNFSDGSAHDDMNFTMN